MNRRRLKLTAAASGLIAGVGWWYVRSHPLVFNESFLEHAHCIAIAGSSLRQYAHDHGGRFPSHTNGYGDALLLMTEYNVDFALTGPGYDTVALARHRLTGGDAPEAEFGRVYVQGLTETNDPDLVLLFDKLPTPGGDHCHGFARLRKPLAREVARVDGSHSTILESRWPAFTREQIEMLIAAGISREQAKAYYAEPPRR